MNPSSRTPEGIPNRCSVCGKRVHISPSRPSADAPCPHCGSLLWFEAQKADRSAPQARRSRRAGDLRLPQPANSSAQPADAPAATSAGASRFTLVDFRTAMCQMRKLGPLKQIMSWIPGMGKVVEIMSACDDDAEQDLKRIEGIIDAMTPAERVNPALIESARRQRIATGSGTGEADVSKLIWEFSAMAGMMDQMAGMSKLQQMRHLKKMSDEGLFDPKQPRFSRKWPRRDRDR